MRADTNPLRLYKDAPSAIATVTISTGQGKPEWGAIPGKQFFILHLQEVTPERRRRK